MSQNDDPDINLYLQKFRQLGLFIQDVEKGISYPNKFWEEMGYSAEEMTGMGFLNFVHEEDKKELLASMDQLLGGREDAIRSLFRIHSRQGEWRWVLSTCLTVNKDSSGRTLNYIGYDHDVTEEINARNRAEQVLKETETLLSAGEIITSELNLNDTIKAILEQAERVISFTSASVQLLKGDKLEIIGERGFGKDPFLLGRQFMPTEKTPNFRIIHDREAMIINRELVFRYPDFNDITEEGIHSWMGVPLIFKDRVIGMMSFDHREEGRFTENDKRLAGAFANQVAIALENSRLYSAAREQAIRDELTGCYTRKHLYSCLERERRMALRNNTPLSLLIFDLDDFKYINDTFGHLAGDSVLKKVVDLAADSLRKTDILCRYGGEEFIAILPSSDLEDAQTAAERIRFSIEQAMNRQDSIHPVTISVGCTTFKQTEKTDGEKMISRADKALYKAKESGKNRTEILS